MPNKHLTHEDEEDAAWALAYFDYIKGGGLLDFESWRVEVQRDEGGKEIPSDV